MHHTLNFWNRLPHTVNPVSFWVKIFSSIGKKHSHSEKTTPNKSLDIKKHLFGSHKLIILTDPSMLELKYLRHTYHFHPLHLEDITSTVQRPKIDEQKDYIFFVFHFPSFNTTTKRIVSKEIDFFLTSTDLIVITDSDFKPMEDILTDINVHRTMWDQRFEKGPGMMMYHMLDILTDSVFPLLETMEKGLELVDKDIFTSEPRHLTEHISFLRRNVVYFESLIKPEMAVFREIESSRHSLITKEMKTYFSNITDHLNKIWDRLEDIKELSENLSRTFESYMSFKTNETIKVLTVFSAIILPLTLLSGIYGMNLNYLPLAEHPLALGVITLVMIGLSSGLLAIFKWRRWI